MKLIKIPIATASISVVLFLIQYGLAFAEKYSFGQIVNHFYPCVTCEFCSAPCYVGYDALLFLILFGVFAISIGSIFLWYLYRFFKKRSGRNN
jgi:uncharacterized membrane protein